MFRTGPGPGGPSPLARPRRPGPAPLAPAPSPGGPGRSGRDRPGCCRAAACPSGQRRGVARLPVINLGLLPGAYPGQAFFPASSTAARRGRGRPAASRPPPPPGIPAPAGPLPRFCLRGGALSFQAGQRRGDPLIPPTAAATPPRGTSSPRDPGPYSSSSAASVAACAATVSPASFRSALLGPVRRLRRIRGDLHPVQRHRPQPAHAQPRAQLQHPAQRNPRPPQGNPPGTGRRSRDQAGSPPQITRNATSVRHSSLDMPRRGHPVRIRPHQHRHQHVRVITRRPRALRSCAAHGTREVSMMLFHHRDHQPDRMIRRQPLTHIRREQERLIPIAPDGTPSP